MRVLFHEMGNKAKIGLLLLMATFMGCNTLKKVGDDELLLTKNSVFADDEKIRDETISSLIVQKPNSNLLGYPLRLNLYNLAKENPDSSFQNWLYRKEKREKRLNRLLSKKQVVRLQESFVVKGASEFLKRIGEAPVVIDTSLSQKTVDRIKAYYNSKGYFNNTGAYEIEKSRRKKRAQIAYKINLGKPYVIDTVYKNILSPDLDSIYKSTADLSLIKKDDQFDLTQFNLERERLTALFRNSGVYNFQESSINYDISRDTIKASDDQLMEVQLNIQNPAGTSPTDSTNTYKVHRFNKINIYSDYLIGSSSDSLKSIEYEDYTIFYNDELKYKPKALADAIFFESDSIYRDLDRIRTYRQITNLNTFKYPNVEFIPDSTDTQLNTNIYLAPRPKFSLGLNFDVTHSNIQRLGTALSASVITRNVFGGAETLNITARGAIGLLSDVAAFSGETFTSEIGGDINITFPRIWFPINTEKIIPYYMLPQSRFLVGTNFQQNIGLDRQTLNTILSYNWSPNLRLKHNIELMNVEFVRNTNPENFFNIYQNTFNNLDQIADQIQDDPQYADFFDIDEDTSEPILRIPGGADDFIDAVQNGEIPEINEEDTREVNSIEERQQRLTENNLIFASSYTYTKNSKSDVNDNDFYQIRAKIESAGNALSLSSSFIPFNENEDGQLLVFGVPFSQYIKTELDYIKHWGLGGSEVFALRSFLGLAIPYGNAESIPFVRSYFAGGSNDNRAWNAYELGPGSTNNLNDFNEANLKIALNFEYRFPIAGDLKGALFADAGNIWNVFDNEDNPDAIFSGFASLADIALGSGMGLRYDFSYFVFRLDVGFKTYNPALEQSRRWFSEYNFRNSVLNVGINYPF
ncbi:BamA/TamA family outer membrane protein [Flagellimonas meridianipacifica]|uniref:Surface antigen-like protein n=1 Tax=Flagellimonas meridianipacifica TaxID=1080225 RepID=A0A2T0MK47_9FLAO|nr:BamA/TamA family outer membrane protein [Allomuricauda pacifica]PRX57943.1 surface antigen-like protein [Allomuricauda pacifica]